MPATNRFAKAPLASAAPGAASLSPGTMTLRPVWFANNAVK